MAAVVLVVLDYVLASALGLKAVAVETGSHVWSAVVVCGDQ